MLPTPRPTTTVEYSPARCSPWSTAGCSWARTSTLIVIWLGDRACARKKTSAPSPVRLAIAE
jgi:hypothetical protein